MLVILFVRTVIHLVKHALEEHNQIVNNAILATFFKMINACQDVLMASIQTLRLKLVKVALMSVLPVLVELFPNAQDVMD